MLARAFDALALTTWGLSGTRDFFPELAISGALELGWIVFFHLIPLDFFHSFLLSNEIFAEVLFNFLLRHFAVVKTLISAHFRLLQRHLLRRQCLLNFVKVNSPYHFDLLLILLYKQGDTLVLLGLMVSFAYFLRTFNQPLLLLSLLFFVDFDPQCVVTLALLLPRGQFRSGKHVLALQKLFSCFIRVFLLLVIAMLDLAVEFVAGKLVLDKAFESFFEVFLVVRDRCESVSEGCWVLGPCGSECFVDVFFASVKLLLVIYHLDETVKLTNFYQIS